MTPDRPDDDFYVGYLPQAPPRIAVRVRRAVALLFAIAVVAAFVFALGQGAFDPGTFEFGVVREFVGVVRERPYPMLDVARPGRGGDAPRASTYALVAFGKHGGRSLVAGLDGRPVRLRGSLIYRDGLTMIEIAEGSIETLSGDAAARAAVPPLAEEPLGERTLRGEIVDAKCFLGVMKPGRSKPHRACAARCISGGIPPVLVVHESGESTSYYLLASASGEPVNREVLPFVAEPVEIAGRVFRRGDLLILQADPAAIRRLGSLAGS